ncbi:MAG: tyrosine-type recombinase/integrase [Burkholderiales bacterium]|nr:tyrosine-type recombinase/integrase [Burkholderiales bacterium]
MTRPAARWRSKPASKQVPYLGEVPLTSQARRVRPKPGFDPQLGARHFAYLRAIAEGVGAQDAAQRYLGLARGSELAELHRDVVERVRALAHRLGDPRWRLIGLEIAQPAPAVLVPSLDEWAEREGYDGFSHAELLELYRERFGDLLRPAEDRSARRRRQRNIRLRDQRLALLRELERAAPRPPQPSDPIGAWIAPDLAADLESLGLTSLGDLARRIGRGGRWWSAIPGYGPVRARRLQERLESLLGAGATASGWASLGARLNAGPAAPGGTPQGDRLVAGQSAKPGRNRVGAAGTDDDPQAPRCIHEAATDAEAVRAWIDARSGSKHTTRLYRRELDRFTIWASIARNRALSDITALDCQAYQDFIADVPEPWISRRKALRLGEGWAPFKGPLSAASQRHAIATLSSCYGWLVRAGYLKQDPWASVAQRPAADPGQGAGPVSKAFTPLAWRALQDALDRGPGGRGRPVGRASIERLRWLLEFAQATGLRASEMVQARRGDLRELAAGWVLRVRGRNDRTRTVPVPQVAIAATRRYFAARGLAFDVAGAELPLLAQLDDPLAPMSYAGLHETLKRFIARAIDAGDMPGDEREACRRASARWLRHTYASRAAERGVPPDILQETLGHADPRTAAGYYRAPSERRQRAIEEAFAADERRAGGRSRGTPNLGARSNPAIDPDRDVGDATP